LSYTSRVTNRDNLHKVIELERAPVKQGTDAAASFRLLTLNEASTIFTTRWMNEWMRQILENEDGSKAKRIGELWPICDGTAKELSKILSRVLVLCLMGGEMQHIESIR
jgi:hypothetical protein